MDYDDQTTTRWERSQPLDLELLPYTPILLGREHELGLALSWLRNERNARALVFCGEVGIGKASLAGEVVRQMFQKGRFQGGVVVVNCQGVVDGNDIIRHILASFDIHGRTLHSAKVADLRLASGRLLEDIDAVVVLLNVASPQVLDDVVAVVGGMSAQILATSDMASPAVPPASCDFIELGPLSLDDARTLASSILQRAGSSADQVPAVMAAVAAILREGNPLAVRLAVSTHSSRLGMTVKSADDSSAPVLGSGTAAITGSLGSAFYSCMTNLPLQARILFIALGALAGPWFRREVAAAIGSALGVTLPGEQLGLLVDVGLLQDGYHGKGGGEILRIHPTFRDQVWAGFETLSDDVQRLSCDAAAGALISTLSHLTSTSSGIELAHIPALIEWAHKRDDNDLLAALCMTVAPWWHEHWQFENGLRYLPWGLGAARATAETATGQDKMLAAASLARAYGLALRHVGNHHAAGKVFQTELALRRQAGDRHGRADALLWLGNIALREADLSEACLYYNHALVIHRESGNRAGVGAALRYLGRIAHRQGRLDKAEKYYQNALRIAEDTADLSSQLWICSYLGSINQEHGRLEDAEVFYRRALNTSRDSADWQGEGLARSFLCDLALDRGQVGKAEQLGRQSLCLSQLAADRPTRAYTLLSLARVATLRKEPGRARMLVGKSLAEMREMSDGAGEVAALHMLAEWN